MHLSEYEKERLLKIQRNKETLEALGLGIENNANKLQTKRKIQSEIQPTSPKKRKLEGNKDPKPKVIFLLVFVHFFLTSQKRVLKEDNIFEYFNPLKVSYFLRFFFSLAHIFTGIIEIFRRR